MAHCYAHIAARKKGCCPAYHACDQHPFSGILVQRFVPPYSIIFDSLQTVQLYFPPAFLVCRWYPELFSSLLQFPFSRHCFYGCPGSLFIESICSSSSIIRILQIYLSSSLFTHFVRFSIRLITSSGNLLVSFLSYCRCSSERVYILPVNLCAASEKYINHELIANLPLHELSATIE